MSDSVNSIASVFQAGGQVCPALPALIVYHGKPFRRMMRAMRVAGITMTRQYKASPRARSAGLRGRRRAVEPRHAGHAAGINARPGP